MTGDPVVHLLAGPNAAGKSTLFHRVIGPATGLPFVNADDVAAREWPGDEVLRARDASARAADLRTALIAARVSFATETVFSHPSKLDLVATLVDAGYLVHLHVVCVPEALSVVRARVRAANGGHVVPLEKVVTRHRRLWPLVAVAVTMAHEAVVYDNTSPDDPFRVITRFQLGHPVGEAAWPAWAPEPLVVLSRPPA